MAKAKDDPIGSVSDKEPEKIGLDHPLRSLSKADIVRLANSDRRSDSWQRGMEYGGLFGLTTGATRKDMTSALARFADGAFGGAVENTMQFPMATAIGGLPLAQMYSALDATAAMTSNGRFDPINQKAPPPIQEFLDIKDLSGPEGIFGSGRYVLRQKTVFFILAVFDMRDHAFQ